MTLLTHSEVLSWLTNGLMVALTAIGVGAQWRGGRTQLLLLQTSISDELANVLAAAQQIALANGDLAYTSDHLLFAEMSAHEGKGRPILLGTGLDLDTMSERLRLRAPATIPPDDSSVAARRHAHTEAIARAKRNDEHPPQATSVLRSGRVLLSAMREAARNSERTVGSDHLLLGILKDRKSNASKLLRECGLTRAGVRAVIKQRLAADRAREVSGQ